MKDRIQQGIEEFQKRQAESSATLRFPEPTSGTDA
jgi:hypothetical protein